MRAGGNDTAPPKDKIPKRSGPELLLWLQGDNINNWKIICLFFFLICQKFVSLRVEMREVLYEKRNTQEKVYKWLP